MVAEIVHREQSPQRLKMSYEEYLKFAGNAHLVEWVDGEVIVYMPPIPQHQQLVLFISQVLNLFVSFFKLGQVMIAPLEVKLWSDGPSREPDIIFVSNENLAQITADRLEGAPDLLVEVISPGSASEDRVRKFSEYERAGVGEYWIIDPRPRKQQADFYLLGQDKLYQSIPIEDDGRYYSRTIPDFWLNVDWLWREPLPDPQLAFAEIMTSLEALSSNEKAVYQALYTLLSRR